jgi:hypothetical protein
MLATLARPHLSARRIAYTIAFAGLLTAALLVAGPGTWQLWAFLVLPDLALLAGISAGLQRGQLHPRAVPLYNALHVLAGPAALAIGSIWLGPAWLAAALAWAAHVAVDRAAGYALRDRDGFIRGD